MTIGQQDIAPDQHQHDPRACKLVPCLLYLRLSDARNEKGSFIDRERALREKAARLGWCVLRPVIENDEIGGDGGERSKSASAFKRVRVKSADGSFAKHPDGRYVMRVWRPGFQSILDALTHGRARAVLAEDLDRTMRDPRDLEDLIDVVQAVRGHADSLSGSLRFTDGGTDSELTMARVMVAVGNKSSRDTARRVSAGRQRKAENGEYGGGRRPYGFGVPKIDGDGVPFVEASGRPVLDYDAVVAHERDEIVAWADAVLAGVPLRSIARDLIARGLPTVRGNPWTSGTVRDILLRPRNAGIMVHQGAELSGRGPWEPILPEDLWRAVVARLNDPTATVTWTTKTGIRRTAARGTNVGRAPLYLGTGLYRCNCSAPVSVQVSKVKARAYRCDVKGDGHVFRNVAKVDAKVVSVLIAWMARPQSAPTLDVAAEGGVDVNALRAKVAVLRERKLGLIADEVDGLINRQERDFGVKRINAKLTSMEAALNAQTDVDPAGPLTEAAEQAGTDPVQRTADVRTAWEALSLGRQRAIIADRLVVTILPTTKKGSRFDEDSVSIDPAPRVAEKRR